MTYRTLLAAVALAALSACAVGTHSTSPAASATLVGRYAQNVSEGFSEIVAYHAVSKSVFITIDSDNTASSFRRVGLRNLASTPLANPTAASNLEAGATTSVGADLARLGFESGGVQTLAISGNLLAIAVQAKPKTRNGVVAFYHLDTYGGATFLRSVEVGSLPDGMAFTPDGRMLVVANEGEIAGDKNFVLAADKSNDPLGTISLIEIRNGEPAPQALSLDFTGFNDRGGRASERPAGIRIGIADNDFARDVEPEYVAISPDSRKAFVTLQENNAVAVVDLNNRRIERLVAMGYKDHGEAANALSPSDRVPATVPFSLKSYPNLMGVYMPDGIASFSVQGTEYFITANEGDDRDDFLASGETGRVASLKLDPTAFPNAAALQANTELGRLTVIKTMGLNSQGEHSKLYALGGRSFSIHNAQTGAQVYDSGSEVERRTYSTLPPALLGKDQVLGRLDNKGPEPESVVVGEVRGKSYAFVGLERASAVLMYDVSNPAQPVFVQWLQNTTDLGKGDVSPEGLAFVPASQSPTGHALLLAGHEVSGSLSVWEVK